MGFAYEHFLKPLLFRLDPERAHEWTTAYMSALLKAPGTAALLRGLYEFKSSRLESDFCGIRFPNPVGLAAGFDKNGRLFPFLSHMGFGFIESGTFTALEQPGNPRPRLFRFPEQSVLLNRMGFNNPGADKVLPVLRKQKKRIPRGINIGKSKLAELDQAVGDYLTSLQKLQEFGDYLTVNVSSPNTPGLRSLQAREPLVDLLSQVKNSVAALGRPLPVLVKIAPDLDEGELDDILETVADVKLDGIIISNTTLDKSTLPESRREEQGGLSGRPLRERSTDMIRRTYKLTQGKLPIIGVGGIFSGADALEKIQAGASLVQVYTGYVYQGPGLPARINAFLDDFLLKEGTSLTELVGSKNTI